MIFQTLKLEKWSKIYYSSASVLQNEVLNKQRYVSDKSCIGFGIESSNSMESDISSGDETLTDSTYENFKREKAYKAVPPPTGTIIPPRANVSFTGIDELAIRNKVLIKRKQNLVNLAMIEIKVILKFGLIVRMEETVVSERAIRRGSQGSMLIIDSGFAMEVEESQEKETIKTSMLRLLRKLAMWEELQVLILLSGSQICDKKAQSWLDLKNIIFPLEESTLFGCNRQQRMKSVYGTRRLERSSFKLDHFCVACGHVERVYSQGILQRRLRKETVREPLELPHLDFIFVFGTCFQWRVGELNLASPEERTAAKEESSVKAHNDDQGLLLKRKRKGIGTLTWENEKMKMLKYFHSKLRANTPPQEYWHNKYTRTDSDDDTHRLVTAGVQTRRKLLDSTSNQHQALLSFIYKQNRTNHKDQQTCLFACFLSQEEPKKVSQALADESWVEAMQEELLQFKLQDVWVLCDLPDGKRVIGTKWVFRNKRDERGTIIKNKARLVAQGYRQEEGVDYDEVFAPVARIEAIRLFLAFASFMGFTVYQMDVKSAFLYGNITEEVYVKQPPGFEDPAHPNKVYRVVKALYGLHQAPRAWYERLSTFLLKHGYRRGAIDKTLFIKKDRRDIMLVQVYVDDIIFGSTKSSMVKDFEELMQKEFKMSSMGELTFFLGLQVKQTTAGIFLSQDKYVKDILNKFDFRTIKPASTPIEAHKSLGKDEEGEDVDVHLYRSMIGCLMYLTASRPDIMFAVCLCARFQVTPKVSHMHAVKRIFRYLKHQPKLGLWYPKDSPFHLEAFSDSDYAGDNHDRRSTSGGCQYLGRRLVSWQCKKQTIVAISSTEAEYVAVASCCAQVLWMQNQLLYYGFNFMNTEIYIDNESTICIVRNPVLHSKTKHIQIRHHFIRDCYEQRLINVVKVHTDDNVADLLTKGFDLARFNFLVVTFESLEALLLRLRGEYE
ncbi:putative ribonuclease H-like domain-containing protein [Tanacetum coccineum]